MVSANDWLQTFRFGMRRWVIWYFLIDRTERHFTSTSVDLDLISHVFGKSAALQFDTLGGTVNGTLDALV